MASCAYGIVCIASRAHGVVRARVQAPVEMSIREGERLALLHGVEPPAGWAIALRVGASGEQTTKGLVPETYVTKVALQAYHVVEAYAPEDEDEARATIRVEAGDIVGVLHVEERRASEQEMHLLTTLKGPLIGCCCRWQAN